MNSNEMLYVSAPSPQEAEQIVDEASSALQVEQSYLDGSSAVLTMSICSCTDEIRSTTSPTDAGAGSSHR